MIALLNGQVVSKAPEGIVIDVSGVGYDVHTTLSTYEKLPATGEAVSLHIYTHVREDSLALYGFQSREEKQLFIKLLKVSGIGPKLALSILSGVPPHDFVEAVRSEDLARLNAIPGVGRKTAERIIVDLKDKLVGMTVQHPSAGVTERPDGIYDDALSALTNLGYNRASAEKVLGKIGVAKGASLTTVIKEALKELANR